jgi:hypothetical protein
MGTDPNDPFQHFTSKVKRSVEFKFVVINLDGDRTAIMARVVDAIKSKGFIISPSSVLVLYTKIFCRDVETGDIKYYSAGRFAYIKRTEDVKAYFDSVLSICDNISNLYGIPHTPEKFIIYYKSISALNIPATAFYKPPVVDNNNAVSTNVVKDSAVDRYISLHDKILPLKSEFFFKFNYSIIRDGSDPENFTGICCFDNGFGIDNKFCKDDVIFLFYIKELLPDKSVRLTTINPIVYNTSVRRIVIYKDGCFNVCLGEKVVLIGKIIASKLC